MNTQLSRERLFVVVDPRDDHHLALERARITARLRPVPPEINVFLSCIDFGEPDQQRVNLYRNQQWFERELHEPLNRAELSHTVTVSWDSQWPRELMQAAQAFEAHTIFLPVRGSLSTSRLTLSDAKWNLLKSAQCPVVLVRPQASEKRKTILAAVNFQATTEAQMALNERILGYARRVANRYTGNLHVVNAYLDTMQYPDRGRLVRASGVASQRIHVQRGYTDEVVSAVAAEVEADIVVIGTLNQRGGHSSLRRGNTAARLIAALRADTMVVN